MHNENPYAALEKIFHEPARLAILSALCAADQGMTFSHLKTVCNLTDGNLNRHLKVLKENEVVQIKKAFVADKPQTTVFISATGLDRFNEYLEALANVMLRARKALPKEKKAGTELGGSHATA